MQRLLELMMRGVAAVLFFTGLGLAAPFVALGMLCQDIADDLEGGWRRGRKQNRLWRWARNQKEKNNG